ncbi:YajQ family cyclic di-GMP-binding protein [Patescibacteria group bacterium]|nr:YajQ family cyclic di-GMP-binding protein [Patescibacteria group bacterium]
MASEHSMDLGVNFDFQEMKNAVDQAKREALNRYDLKDAGIEIDLGDESLKVTAQSENQVVAVFDIVIKKMVGRGLSSRILDKQKMEEIGGMRVRQEAKLVKALDSENAKSLSKKIREAFPKVKPLIQGETLRVVSKSIDDLQAIRKMLSEDESVKVPLDFGNFR